MLSAAQGIDLALPDGPARLGHAHIPRVRRDPQDVSDLAHDRPTSPDIEALAGLIRSGAVAAGRRYA